MKTAPDFIATYRLQLSPEFGFDAARDIVPYLASLGVSHLYLSPIFEARPGSTHGYDQTDPTHIRAQLGGETAFVALAESARAAGLGILLDIVPNHMAAHHANPWWWGLLKHGRGSPFDRFFDVWWDENHARLVLPVLGATPQECAAKGELRLTTDPALGPCIAYFDHRFPLRDDTPPPTADPADPATLLDLLSRQHFELAFWRDGLTRINYRRFFDIADLAGLCVEHDEVFDTLHSKPLELVNRGFVHALRIDHIDGLLNPLAYLTKLRAALDAAAGPGAARVPIFVEKILAHDESLPPAWPVDGATGYEFLAVLSQLASNPHGVEALQRHAAPQGQAPTPFPALAAACKRDFAQGPLRPEFARVSSLFERTLAAASCPLPTPTLQSALLALSAHLSVYRTYADDDGLSPDDQARIRRAAHAAAVPALSPDSPLLHLLTLSGPFAHAPHRPPALHCLRRWQQFTGPLAAKGVEDTALYRDTACPWLCDVGSEPIVRDHADVLAHLMQQRRAHPLALNATDTHDAKRSEDVRALLATLSHHHVACQAMLDEASALAADQGVSPPDVRLLTYSLFSLLEAAASPLDLAPRLNAYMVKAAREAKLHTSWLTPAPAYEDALARVIDRMLAPAAADFLTRLRTLRARVHQRAVRTSLAQCMLKALLPGVPDFYQGDEVLTLSLVDPDNRRAVDFPKRRALLRSIIAGWPARAPEYLGLLASPDAMKLFVTWRLLTLRKHLNSQGQLRLDTFHSSNQTIALRVAAGQLRCTANLALEGPLQDPAAPAHPAPPADQLAGLLTHEGRPWARVTLEDATSPIELA